jgi:hypothetical protein
VAVALMHLDALRVPLVGDDYFFIEKAERVPAWALWAPRLLVSGFYRPWSRELHFAWLHGVAGLAPLPFHIANLVLAMVAAALYFTLVGRMAGPRIAATATAAMVTLAGWGVLVVWASGAQDLWMIVAALLGLHAVLSRRAGWAGAACAMALLSKESAATLPLIMAAASRLPARRPWRSVARDVLPSGVVLAAWAALHPRLGGRLWYAHGLPLTAATRPGAGTLLCRTLLSAIQLDALPSPERGWGAALLHALPAGVLLLAAIALAWRMGRGRQAAEEPRPDRWTLAGFGALWAAAGWLPLAMPGVGWHPYYTLFGALGAWLAVTVVAGPRVVAALVVPLVVLGAARAGTPSGDWGTEWFQRRAAAFIAVTQQQLLALHRSLPKGSRLYFSAVPSGIGLVPGGDDSPVLRVWYHDPALRAAFLSRYRARARGDTAGRDLFFRFDPDRGWIELVAGTEDMRTARAANPRWHEDHEQLAAALLAGGDVVAARDEFAKLVQDRPRDPDDALALALCQCQLGERQAAAAGFARVLALPGATPAVRAEAGRGCP